MSSVAEGSSGNAPQLDPDPNNKNTTTRDALLQNGSDSRFRKLLYDLDHLSEVIAQGRARIAEQIDLTPPQYNIIMLIAEKQGDTGISVSRVANFMHVSGPFITTQSNILVKRGLLEKVPNPEDKRSILLKLTDHGEMEISRLRPGLRLFNDQVFGKISREQFEEYLKITNVLIDNWDDAERYLPRLKRRPE